MLLAVQMWRMLCPEFMSSIFSAKEFPYPMLVTSIVVRIGIVRSGPLFMAISVWVVRMTLFIANTIPASSVVVPGYSCQNGARSVSGHRLALPIADELSLKEQVLCKP
jgi:hypothetical protein